MRKRKSCQAYKHSLIVTSATQQVSFDIYSLRSHGCSPSVAVPRCPSLGPAPVSTSRGTSRRSRVVRERRRVGTRESSKCIEDGRRVICWKSHEQGVILVHRCVYVDFGSQEWEKVLDEFLPLQIPVPRLRPSIQQIHREFV